MNTQDTIETLRDVLIDLDSAIDALHRITDAQDWRLQDLQRMRKSLDESREEFSWPRLFSEPRL